MSLEGKPKDEILLSVLEYLDRNGYKDSFNILLQNTGLRYLENVKKNIENLLKNKKIDELIIYVNTCNKLNYIRPKQKNFLFKIKIYIKKYVIRRKAKR